MGRIKAFAIFFALHFVQKFTDYPIALAADKRGRFSKLAGFSLYLFRNHKNKAVLLVLTILAGKCFTNTAAKTFTVGVQKAPQFIA